ncbi:major facilitator superfamily mfs-1 [Ophiostoma piceae UAMH 11346]|uniref:Major facilitator superfamily mfs-1 n=1 Tax=Ophiostoma piceae (strain UAMH 11346) TaxID=1262450 RepID=S3C9C7_OPHP1|nr:major facilitator superfamily mfs-1 [Ophiostoma piceae UAMH 11346]
MNKKTYLRAPNDDYEPDKHIRLGQIWTNRRDPATCIAGTPLPLTPDSINHTWKAGWTFAYQRGLSGKFRLWAELDVLPVGASVGILHGTTTSLTYTMPFLDTFSIEPMPDYVRDSVAAAVTAEPTLAKDHKRLYMVTGVKIARGGQGAQGTLRTTGGSVSASVNVATATGGVVPIPVTPGASAGLDYVQGTGQAFYGASDYVFAYRLREILYRRATLSTRPSYQGAMLGISDAEAAETPDGTKDEFSYVLEEACLDKVDVGVEKGEQFVFADEGEECAIMLMRS